MADIKYLDPGAENDYPVLLLHGLGVDASSWSLQFTDLIKAGFRPIAVDVPGFGSSPTGKAPWSIRRVTGDIAKFLNDKNIISAHVVGLSMGGTIAQQLAFDFPDIVSKLVLANTFSVLRPSSLKGWAYFVRRFILVHTLGLQAQAKFVAGRIFPYPEQEMLRNEIIKQITNADPGAYRAAMRSLGTFNSKPRLSEINVPTLVITGANDTTVNPGHQAQMAAWIPGASQVIIEKAGHAASVEFPEEFNRIMVDFLLK
jgi:3-oxoadipate enol-lactonase